MAHRSIPPIDSEPRLAPAPRGVAPWSATFDRARARPASIALAMVAVAAVALVGWWLLRPATPPAEAALPLADSTSATAESSSASEVGGGGGAPGETESTTSTTTVELVVQAAGAVEEPGVYRLPAGARVDDLIQAADGLTDKADRSRLNLASALSDGDRIWVPARGEGDPPEVVSATPGAPVTTPAASGGAGGTGSTPGPTEPIDLNGADATMLDSLPGVGPATAASIISYREESGPFRSVDDLLEVRGIGEAKLEQLRPLVHV